MISCRFAFAIILFIGFMPSHAEITQEALQEEVTVTVKLVQVYVTDKKGNPVTDLKRSDFALLDNGKSVKITEFERHILSLPGEKPEQPIQAEKPAETFVPPPLLTRKFLLFFDFAFNETQGIPKAKKTALHFIDAQVRPEDEIGIIENLDAVDPASRAVLEQNLVKRYFIPVIKRIVQIEEIKKFTRWHVHTDMGARRFEVLDRRSFRRLPGGGMIIVDVDGNRFRIPDRNALEEQSRCLLDLHC